MFFFGLLIGAVAGAYLTYRYRVQIQEWLDLSDD